MCRALEIGCGEGRVSREMKTLGFQVTATEAIAELVEAARLADRLRTTLLRMPRT
jgi:2-polyprenyl-3-methyl-5-hydroxy-6-metoxy-1,4-benzoquinol methylase